MRNDAAAPGAFQSFLSSSGTRAARCVNGARLGDVVNALYIGVAAASYWLIGGSPRINSIVRNTPDVVYSVLSTMPRREKGLTAISTDQGVNDPTVLRVVFEDEDRRFLPGAVETIHELAERQAVVSHHYG